MKAVNLFIVFMILISFSCKRDGNSEKNPLEELNGTYSGAIYKWNRNWDSTFTNVVETFDTLKNVSGELEINVASNTIKFGNVIYPIHDTLFKVINKDTLVALMSYSTHPYRSITIINSSKFVKVWESSSASTGPWAYSIVEEYYKN